MNCPNCNALMKKGFLPVNRGRLYWSPEGQRVPWNVSKIPNESVILSKFTITTPIKVEAYICVSCKFVLVPIKAEDE